MKPSEKRTTLIKKTYWKVRKYSGRPFAEIQQEILRYFENEHPNIDKVHVNEILHQMIMADCFNFSNGSGESEGSLSVWERKTYLKHWIDGPMILRRVLDKLLIGIISREVGTDDLDCEGVSALLYGSSEDPELVAKARRLVGKTVDPIPN